MRALTISAHGGLEQLVVRDDLPEPAIRERTDVRIRVRAAALNHTTGGSCKYEHAANEPIPTRLPSRFTA